MTTPEESCREADELKIVQKMLYAYERELGNRLGFDPIKQGDDFIAAMTCAYKECLTRLASRPTNEGEIETAVKEKWKEIKPSLEAQKIRAALSFGGCEDIMPDYVWDIADIAAEMALAIRAPSVDMAGKCRHDFKELIGAEQCEKCGVVIS